MIKKSNNINLSAIVEDRQREFDALPPRVLDPQHKAPEAKRAPFWKLLLPKLTQWSSRR